jgi:ferredoxin-NADP reductase
MYRYFVVNNHKLTSSTLLLTLKKDVLAKDFVFLPGQYVTISFKRNGRPTPARCFSIANSPTEKDIIQLSIRIRGRYTGRVAELNIGDEVQVRGPFGSFVFDENIDKDVVMLAGGMGIAPLISIVHYVSNINLTNKINLLYSCKDQDDVPFIEQLTDLMSSNQNFKITLSISGGLVDKLTKYNVISGRITPEVIDANINNSYAGKRFFICGPPQFMNSMASILHKKGVSAGNIMMETFSQGPNSQTGKIRSWPMNIYAFGAIGVVLGGLAVMISDILNILPSNSALGSSSLVDSNNATNSRQAELDNLVNSLPLVTNPAPLSPSAASSGTQQTSSSTSAPTTTTAPTATKTTPAPVCTTSQSTGLTTCI